MIVWRTIQDELPPLMESVLLAVQGEAESSEGHRRSAKRFVFTDGHEAGGVYAWAFLPPAPAMQPTLKPLRTRRVRTKGGHA